MVASKLVFDDGVLRIEGLDRDRSVVAEVRFNDVLLVRITDEGTRLRLLQELGESRGLVLSDEDSNLIDWLAEEGLYTRDLATAKHFLVLVGEEITDVVSFSNPEIEALRCVD